MYKVLVVALAAAVFSAGLALWQNTPPVLASGRVEDLQTRTAAMAIIQQQIDLFRDRQVETRQAVEKLQELAIIGTYARYYRISRSLAALIYASAAAHKFEPELVFRIVDAESNFNPSDVSEKGAVGLMQVLPSTAANYGVTRSSLFDAETSMNVGLLHLRNCLWAEGNDIVKALDRYNRGSRPDATHRYASRILKGDSPAY